MFSKATHPQRRGLQGESLSEEILPPLCGNSQILGKMKTFAKSYNLLFRRANKLLEAASCESWELSNYETS